MRAPRRVRSFYRLARGALATLGLCGVFVCAVAFGLLLHIDLPLGRRITAQLLASILSNTFQGRISIGRIEHLSARSLLATNIDVYDVYGANVLRVDSVRGEANALQIIRELLFGGSKVTLLISHVRVENAETQIITDPTTGEPTIVRAFTPKPSKLPKAPPSARQIRVRMPIIEVGQGYGRGRIGQSPTFEAQVRNVRGSVWAGPTGTAVDIPRFGAVIRGIGGTDASGTSAVHIRAPGPIWWTFDGYFGSVPIGTFLRADGKHLTISADIVRAKPDALKAWIPSWPLRQDVSAHLEASGVPPLLDVQGQFSVGTGKLSAQGTATLSPASKLDLDVRGRALDLRALFPELPATRVDADATLSIFGKQGLPVVNVKGSTHPTRIAELDLPAIDVLGTLEKQRFTGSAAVHEPGVPLQVAFGIDSEGDVDFDARARRVSIDRAPRVKSIVPARGEFDVRARGTLKKARISAEVDADLRGFTQGFVTLATGHLTGRASGRVDSPQTWSIDAALAGHGLAAGKFAFDNVNATAAGNLFGPHLHATLDDAQGRSVQADATLRIAHGPSLDNLSLEIAREGVSLKGRVASLDLALGNVEVRDLHIAGAGGTLDGWLRVQRSTLEFKVDGENLDLDAIARVLALPRGMVGGKARLSAEVSAGHDVQRGRIFLALGDATLASIPGVSLRLDAELDDAHLTGNLSGQVREIGAFGASWDAVLAGRVNELRSFRDVIGKAEVDLDRVELGNLVYFVPESAHVEELRGQAYAKIRVERAIPAALPSITLDAIGTHGLEIVQAQGENDARPPLRISDLDLHGSGTLDGETGALKLDAALYVRNDIFVSASARSHIDLARAVKQPSGILAQLAQTPLQALVIVPEQNLERLPADLRPTNLSGSIGARAALGGTLEKPVAGVSFDARNLVATGSRFGVPINLEANAQYEKASGRFAIDAGVLEHGARVAEFTAHGSAHFPLPSASSGLAPWTGSAELSLLGLPVQTFPPLAEKRIAGVLHGTFSLQRTGVVPELAADVQIRDASVDQVPVGNGRFSARSVGNLLQADLRFDSERGSLNAGLGTALDFKSAFPKIDDAAAISARADAKNFDCVLLQPLLGATFSELQGRMNAALTAKLQRSADPASPGQMHWNADLRGDARIAEGRLTIPALGLELRDVSARATAQNAGRRTTITIPDMIAKARSDQRNVRGNAVLVLDGLRFDHGTANLAVTPRMPLLIQGVTEAYVTGNAVLTFEHEPTQMRVRIDLSHVRAQLPRASGRALIPIEDNRDITVLQPLHEPTEGSDAASLPWVVAFNLKKDVLIQRNDMTVPIAGNAELRLGNELEVTGRIQLNEKNRIGRVSLFGKSFEIEQGEIDFDTGESDNPRVDITARTRTPDGTLIFVDLYGPFKEAKFTFRSEPPTADPLKLLLAGPTSTDSEGSGAAAMAGAGAVGGAAFQELFGSTPLGSVVEFRSSTAETTDKASYTAAVRISEKIWFEGTYRVRDFNQQGNTPNTDAADLSGTVDWRFRPRWSARTEVGTLGAGIDLLWQYRY